MTRKRRPTEPLFALWTIFRKSPISARALRAWERTYAGSFQTHWQSCSNAETLLGIYARTGDRKSLALAASACARAALVALRGSVDSPSMALDAVDGWARGEQSSEEVVAAAWRVKVAEIDETRDPAGAVHAPAAARYAALCAGVVEKPNRVTAGGYAESAALNAWYALVDRGEDRGRLAELVRARLPVPTYESIRPPG